MTHTLHPLAEDYLERLERAAAHLPRARRRELVDEIEAHIVEAVGPDPTEVEVRNVLERLGTPEEIADAEAPRPAPKPRMGTAERATVWLLPLGGFAVGVGWLLGLFLLWNSRAWTLRDKLIGTLLIPGGIATAFQVWLAWALSESCVAGPGDPCDSGLGLGGLAAIVLAIVPIVSAIYLAKRANLNRPG